MLGALDFMFIEKDETRANHLNKLVGSRYAELRNICNVKVSTGEFIDKMSGLLDSLEAQRRQGEPMFAMIDPFGVSQTPMSIIRRILLNSRSEVYISVMYEFINRFISIPEFSASLDGLYGTTDWKQALNIDGAAERKDYLYRLYKEQLKKAGAKHVHHFDLYRGNDMVYSLFFATKNDLGSDRMKRAMWKVAPFGDFAFRSSTRDQMTFGLAVLDPDALGRELISKFGTYRQLSIEEIERFMCSDRTPFHTGHLKECLALMEEQGAIEVVKGTRRRRKSFPPGTQLMFVEPPPPSPPKPSQGEFRF